MRWAKSTAACGSSTSTIRTANSSPPRRATVSPGRTIDDEQPAGPHQDAVAHVVAEGVVDRLESVEVAEAQGHRPARPGRRGQGVLHPVVEERPVGQAGELVVEGQVAEVGLEGVTLAVRGLEGVGVHLDLVGLPGDPSR